MYTRQHSRVSGVSRINFDTIIAVPKLRVLKSSQSAVTHILTIYYTYYDINIAKTIHATEAGTSI